MENKIQGRKNSYLQQDFEILDTNRLMNEIQMMNPEQSRDITYTLITDHWLLRITAVFYMVILYKGVYKVWFTGSFRYFKHYEKYFYFFVKYIWQIAITGVIWPRKGRMDIPSGRR